MYTYSKYNSVYEHDWCGHLGVAPLLLNLSDLAQLTEHLVHAQQ